MARYGYVSLSGSGSDWLEDASDELLVNGNSLTQSIEGYRQLSVSGRGLVPYEVSSVNYLNRSGARPTQHRTGTRDFTVKYLLEAESSEELRFKYTEIMRVLSGVLSIGFKDDKDFTYEGVYLTGAESSEEVSNKIVSTFTLTAFDPYRYSREESVADTVEIVAEYVPVEEVRILFKGTITRPTIQVRNGLYTTGFRLVGTVNAGTEVKVKINQQTGRIITEGASVELGTMPREFVLYNGATGKVLESSTSEVTFVWRDRRL